MTKYWITTHWPRYVGAREKPSDGIWLRDNTKVAAKGLSPGDRVAVYEPASGKVTLADARRGERRVKGKAGVIAILKVESFLKPTGGRREKYTDGKWRRWAWKAETTPEISGFIPRIKVNSILDIARAYVFHGIGKKHSGLRKIEKKQLEELARQLRKSRHKKEKIIRKRFLRPKIITSSRGGESPQHKKLKELIAEHPELVFKTREIYLVGKEFRFHSGDRCDVLLSWRSGDQLLAVEVEPAVKKEDIIPVQQAVKYRALADVQFRYSPGKTLGFLVALRIPKHIKNLCDEYGIGYVECKGDPNRWEPKWPD